MLSRNPDLISLSNLKDLDPASFNWFGEATSTALSGRCLLDVLEYLRAIPPFSAQFRQVTNAHAVRLACRCLSDEDLQAGKILARMKPHILSTCKQLRKARKDQIPHYGEDFWDWAVVLEALTEAYARFPNEAGLSDAVISNELTSFYDGVVQNIKKGLTIPANKHKEWYGPATAAVAHHILAKHRDRLGGNVDAVLDKLRQQALVEIKNGKYRGRPVELFQQLWHYGQVVAEFPRLAKTQAKCISNLSSLEQVSGKADRVYALARVLQGVVATDKTRTAAKAVQQLNACEDQGRPLGQGLMGDNVKGSLNALEALWSMLEPAQKSRIHAMIDALTRARLNTNTVGIVVAIGNEMDAAKQAFTAAGARIALEEPDTVVFEHEDYRVVACGGKAITGVHEATKKLIDTHGVKWLIMFGVAGSLAKFKHEPGKTPRLLGKGPDLFEVVIATSLAPYLIYQKIRKKIENAGVPFHGKQWREIPTDPVLFGLAHETAEKLFENKFSEGLIVTGTAVVDLLRGKEEVLVAFPGGLAAETEGYTVGLLCLQSGIPYLVIRGISDTADGGKLRQGRDKKREREEQMQAAVAAANVAVGVVKLLSGRW
jgi:nucleoside phosphorylase